jgi:histidinol-phosphate/aromatic aminotransferase/cobyric acid decarboxylase-like protein
MDDNEAKAKYNIGETCCASISLDDLASLSEQKNEPVISFKAKMNYGEIPGLKDLRINLANLYSSKVGRQSSICPYHYDVNKSASPLPPDNILITPGAIAANHLVFYGLIGPDDHVICHYPTYQQLYEIPTSLGAEVDLWKAVPEKNWIPDLEELKKLIKSNTKLIVIK